MKRSCPCRNEQSVPDAAHATNPTSATDGPRSAPPPVPPPAPVTTTRPAGKVTFLRTAPVVVSARHSAGRSVANARMQSWSDPVRCRGCSDWNRAKSSSSRWLSTSLSSHCCSKARATNRFTVRLLSGGRGLVRRKVGPALGLAGNGPRQIPQTTSGDVLLIQVILLQEG
jgi:hypothetical protein